MAGVRSALGVVVLCLCCLGWTGATTWMVTVPKDTSSNQCTTPSNCSFPGALTAAKPGDTIEFTTSVFVSSQITINAWKAYGTVKVEGRNHVVHQEGTEFRILGATNWLPKRVLQLSHLTFQGWMGPTNDDALLCLSEDDACLAPATRPRPRPGPRTKMPRPAPTTAFRPSLILNNVVFRDNFAGAGMVGVWDKAAGNGVLGAELTQCTFLNNSAFPAAYLSGAILSLSARSQVTECLFERNRFADALISIESISGYPATISQVKAWGNKCINQQGTDCAVVQADKSHLTIEYSTFVSNPGAIRGVTASNLTMVGSFLQTPPGTTYQINSNAVSLGETEISQEGGGVATVRVIVDWVYIRNPMGNFTVGGAPYFGKCAESGAGPVGCSPDVPCRDLATPEGGYYGYSCAPAEA